MLMNIRKNKAEDSSTDIARRLNELIFDYEYPTPPGIIKRKRYVSLISKVLVYQRKKLDYIVSVSTIKRCCEKGRLLATLKNSKEELLNDPVTKDYEDFYIHKKYKDSRKSKTLRREIINYIQEEELPINIEEGIILKENEEKFKEKFKYIDNIYIFLNQFS